jgi:hypothetical protein
MAYTKYSLTPANNTAAPPDGAPEGMLPSAVNDTMRDMMAQIRDVGDGIRDGTYTMTAPKITGGTITGSTINNSAIGGTTAAAGAFTTLSATGATTFSGATVVSGSLTSNTFSSSGATITGGTINSTAIGGTTAAVGKFTTLEATGVTTVQAGTVSDPAITTTGDTNTGIFFPAADTIAFTEGGAEAMRITSSGDVCIGTTTANAKLEVVGGQFRVANTSTAALCIISTDSTSTNGITIESSYYGGAGYGPMKFNAGGSERMRIASDGNIAVGATGTSGSRFTVFQPNSLNTLYLVNANATTAYGMQIYYSGRSPNNTGEEFIYCGDTGQRFSARSNGGLANYSGNNVNLSDEREKTNIELAGNYLSKICAIPVKTFNYIDQNREEDDGLTLGVIAQDVQNVAPELIMESNWGTKEEPKMRFGIYQTDLQYALMKSIQELNAKVEAQAAEIALLKSK